MLEDKFCANCGSKITENVCKYCGQLYGKEQNYIVKGLRWLGSLKWYKNPLIVAIVGSIIVASAQFSAAIIQIYMSNDGSDFNINVDNSYIIYKNVNLPFYRNENLQNIYILNETSTFYINSNMQERPINSGDSSSEYINTSSFMHEQYVTVNDVHHTLKPYLQSVYITAENVPRGFNIEIVPPRDTKPPFKAKMYITFTNEIDLGNYNITIKAAGSDGKEKYCKVYVTVYEYTVGRYSNLMREVQLDKYGIDALQGMPHTGAISVSYEKCENEL